MHRSTALAHRIARLLAGACLMLLVAEANAVVTCSIAVANIGPVAYNNPTTSMVQSSFTLTCSASNNPGLGTYNFNIGAANAPVTVTYTTSSTGGCPGTTWGTANGTDTIAVPLTLVTKNVAVVSPAVPFWICAASGQIVAAGTYVGTTSLTLTGTSPAVGGGGAALSPTPQTFTVSILTPATCTISTAPGTIGLAYTGLGGLQTASTTFGTTCTSTLPYTMALSPTSGTLVGIAYTLALSAASATGTGVAQGPYTITATAAGGQAGDCTAGGTVVMVASGCRDNATHTLTLTY